MKLVFFFERNMKLVYNIKNCEYTKVKLMKRSQKEIINNKIEYYRWWKVRKGYHCQLFPATNMARGMRYMNQTIRIWGHVICGSLFETNFLCETILFKTTRAGSSSSQPHTHTQRENNNIRTTLSLTHVVVTDIPSF